MERKNITSHDMDGSRSKGASSDSLGSDSKSSSLNSKLGQESGSGVSRIILSDRFALFC